MKLTLQKAKRLLARYAHSGACETNPRALEKINEARERLMKKAQNWKGKMQRYVFCTNSACLTLPREIETLEAVSLCSSPLRMRSQWYEVLEGGPGILRSGGTYGVNDYHRAIVDRGDGFCTFADLCEARNIKVYCDVPESAGARILLQGFDSAGNRVRTYDETTAAYVDGEYVDLDNETPAVSTTVFSALTSVQKPETNGFVRLYAFTAGVAGSAESDTATIVNQTSAPLGPGTLSWTGDLFGGAAAYTGDEDDMTHVVSLTAALGYLPLETITARTVGITILIDVDSENFPVDDLALMVAGTYIRFESGALAALLYDAEQANPSTIRFIIASADNPGNVVGQELEWQDIRRYWQVSQVVTLSGVNCTPVAATAIWDGATGDADASLLVTLPLTTDPQGATNIVFTLTDVLNPVDYLGNTMVFALTRAFVDAVTATPDYSAAIAVYHPDETNPSYRRYYIPGLATNADGSAQDSQQCVVMAKMRYLPISSDTDFVGLEHVGALKHMLLAINMEENGELKKALVHEEKAAQLLAEELQNYLGDAATANQGMQLQTPGFSAGDIPFAG